jgi:hypothetical protein
MAVEVAAPTPAPSFITTHEAASNEVRKLLFILSPVLIPFLLLHRKQSSWL